MHIKGLWRSATALLGAALFATACQGTQSNQAMETNAPTEEQASEGSNPYTNEAYGKDGSALRKGSGGLNGDPDYCNVNVGNPAVCSTGEGDCDTNFECSAGAAGVVCAADNGGRFTAATGGNAISTDDMCVPSTCLNNVQDGGETGIDCGGPCGSCEPDCSGSGAPGNADFCTFHCKCTAGNGDCDGNLTCVPGTICTNDVGHHFGQPGDYDFCLAPSCSNNVQDGGETGIDCGGPCGTCTCVGAAAGSECTPGCPCTEDGGDCDKDADCAPGLKCQEQGAVDRCHFVCNAWNPAADPGAPGSVRGPACGDDQFSADLLTNGALPGFDFQFHGVQIQRLVITTNGSIDFKANECQGSVVCAGPGSAQWVNYAFPRVNNQFARAAVFFDDLFSCTNNQPGGAVNNDVRYAVLGSAPNRRLVVSWSNISLFGNQTADIGSYQMILTEGTDDIDYNYRNTGPNGVFSNDGSVTVGTNDGLGGFTNFPALGAGGVTPRACFNIAVTP